MACLPLPEHLLSDWGEKTANLLPFADVVDDDVVVVVEPQADEVVAVVVVVEAGVGTQLWLS